MPSPVNSGAELGHTPYAGIAHAIGLPVATVSRSSPGARNPLNGQGGAPSGLRLGHMGADPDLFVNR
jgi:hypothetical protein